MKKNIIILFLLSFAVTAKNLVPEDYWNIQKVANPQVNSSGNVVAFLKTYIDNTSINLFGDEFHVSDYSFGNLYLVNNFIFPFLSSFI